MRDNLLKGDYHIVLGSNRLTRVTTEGHALGCCRWSIEVKLVVLEDPVGVFIRKPTEYINHKS